MLRRGDLGDHLAAFTHQLSEIIRRVVREDAALVENQHAAARHVHLVQDVSGDENRVMSGQTFDELADGTNLVRVETDGWLVENDELRLVDQRIGEADTLLVTLRQMANDAMADVLQPALFHHRVHPLAGLGAAQTLQAGAKSQILLHPHVAMQRVVLRHVADAPAHFIRLGENIEARHAHRAAGGRHEAGQHAHDGALPGAIRPEQAHDLA